jgi:hypothetical protein
MKSIIANSEDESVAFSSNNLSVENNLPVSISGIKKVYSVSVEELSQHSSLSRSGKVTIELQKEFISGSYIYLTNSELTQLGMDYNLYSIEETGFLYNGNYYESDTIPSYADSIRVVVVRNVRVSSIRITHPEGGNFRFWANIRIDYSPEVTTDILDTLIAEHTFSEFIRILESTNRDWTFSGFYIEGTDILVTAIDGNLLNKRIETRWVRKKSFFTVSSFEITAPDTGDIYNNHYYTKLSFDLEDSQSIIDSTLPSGYAISSIIKEINVKYPEWKFMGFFDTVSGTMHENIDLSIQGKSLVAKWEQTQRTIMVHFIDENGNTVKDDYGINVRPESLTILRNSLFSTSLINIKNYMNYYNFNEFYEESSFKNRLSIIDWYTEAVYVRYGIKKVKISTKNTGSDRIHSFGLERTPHIFGSLNEYFYSSTFLHFAGYSISEKPKSLSEIMTLNQSIEYMRKITDSTREVIFYEQFKYDSPNLMSSDGNFCSISPIYYNNHGPKDYYVSIANNLRDNSEFINFLYLDSNVYTVDYTTKLIRLADFDEKREFERRMSNVFKSKDKVSKIGGIVTGIQKTTSEEINKLLGKGYIELQTSNSSWVHNSFYIASESLEVSNLNFVFKWNTYGNYMDGSYSDVLLSISYRPGYSPQSISVSNKRIEYHSTKVAMLDFSTVLKEYFK